MLSKSRFNPAPGLIDFWNEIRRPHPHRWPILALSLLPAGLILYWAFSQVEYKAPERPEVIYIATFDPDRSDAEIIASNRANQEVKELRAAEEERIARRKRELYKALGAMFGMDVEEMERKAELRRAAELAAEQRHRAELLGAPAAEGARR
jgi:hypothetical protein